MAHASLFLPFCPLSLSHTRKYGIGKNKLQLTLTLIAKKKLIADVQCADTVWGTLQAVAHLLPRQHQERGAIIIPIL